MLDVHIESPGFGKSIFSNSTGKYFEQSVSCVDDVDLTDPIIPYRETIKSKVKIQGKYGYLYMSNRL